MGENDTATEPPTLRSDLARILLDPTTHEKLCDVRLKSAIDGEEVRAVRSILGARSAPLLVLLRGDFAEGTSEVVKMQLRGDTLRALVEYCYTDEFKITETGRHSHNAATCIELVAAANLYELKALSTMVRNEVTILLDSNHGLVGKYLQALVCTPNAKETWDGKGILMHVQAHIHRDMKSCLLPNEGLGISCLGLEALEIVLSNFCCLACTTADQFDLLKRWAEYADNRKLLSTDASSDVRRHVSLGLLRPSFLRDVVVPTGLFDQPQLAAAYETIAITTEAMDAHQAFHYIENAKKFRNLSRLLFVNPPSKMYTTLVFVREDKICDTLSRSNFGKNCSFITRSSDENNKTAALDKLRNEYVCASPGHVLVTTYSEALKLDVPRVDRVINFDLPSSVEDYIRGISYLFFAGERGERRGAGFAISFVDHYDKITARRIVELFHLHRHDPPDVLTKESDWPVVYE